VLVLSHQVELHGSKPSRRNAQRVLAEEGCEASPRSALPPHNGHWPTMGAKGSKQLALSSKLPTTMAPSPLSAHHTRLALCLPPTNSRLASVIARVVGEAFAGAEDRPSAPPHPRPVGRSHGGSAGKQF